MSDAEQRAVEPPTLASIVQPLTAAQFRADYWATQTPFVGAASELVVRALRGISGLESIDALLAQRKADVNLFGPRGVRTVVPAGVAKNFLHNGFNLYLTHVEADIPAVHHYFCSIARDLGFSPLQVSVEAFAGSAGQVSSRHYDHDINFQILLQGDKTWCVQRNTLIDNPLMAYHPTAIRFPEEAIANSKAIPTAFDGTCVSHDVHEGSVLFLPRAYWHETTSHSDTFGVNMVLRGTTFATGMARAIEARLHRQPQFRAFLDGIVIGQADPPSRQQEFAALKAAAIAAIERITIEEAALASTGSQRFQWAAGADGRRVSDEPPRLHVPGLLDRPVAIERKALPCIRELVSLRSPFSWNHALIVLDDLGVISARSLLGDLMSIGVLESARN